MQDWNRLQGECGTGPHPWCETGDGDQYGDAADMKGGGRGVVGVVVGRGVRGGEGGTVGGGGSGAGVGGRSQESVMQAAGTAQTTPRPSVRFH